MVRSFTVSSFNPFSKPLAFQPTASPLLITKKATRGANSAAWIVGHLAVSLRRTAERLGATGVPAVAPEVVDRFTQTKKPAEAQADLGNPADLVKLFDACLASVIAAAKAVPAGTLAGPSTSPSPIAQNFAEGLLFGSLHVAMHSGQLSTIRRSLGKPPVV